MSEQKVMNRWLVVVGAILIQLCLGAIYAWSVFTPALSARPGGFADIYSADYLGVDQATLDALKKDLDPLKTDAAAAAKEAKAAGKQAAAATDEGSRKDAEARKAAASQRETQAKSAADDAVKARVPADRVKALSYGFTKAQTQMIFSAGLALFAIIMVIAGRVMPRVGPRKLAIAGSMVLGVAYILAGLLAGTSFLANLLLVGVLGGAGIGLAYVVPIAVGMRWFPDKKGLITGLAVAGFGFGATLWVMLAGPWATLIANLGVPGTFLVYGIIFLVAGGLGGIFMTYPPDGWKPTGWNPPAPVAGAKAAGTEDFESGEMLRTSQFFMIFLTFLFGAGAGLMVIGNIKLFGNQELIEAGLNAKAAGAATATAMGVFYALANGLGRIAWGSISDKIGRKLSLIIMTAIQGVTVIAFQWMAGTVAMLYLGATLIGFNFGGNFALFPTITADTFGTKNVSRNYGWVFLAYGLGGIIGPIMAGKLGDAGMFELAFTICGIACLVAAGIIALVKPAQRKA